MRFGRRAIPFLAAAGFLFLLNACRKTPVGQNPETLQRAQTSTPAAAADFLTRAIEIHRASQEMALDGFQYGKDNLGWPFDAGATSSQAYLTKLIEEKFLPADAYKWFDGNLRVANLSDADPGETAFLKLTQPDQGILIVKKNGQSAILQDTAAADGFAKKPPREPAWLP